jgi:methionyl-tRNA formyltransferase
MEMVKALDAGPIYLQRAVAIDPMEDAGRLSDRLAGEGASLLLETLERIDSGGLGSCEQPDEGVSSAPRLSKGDGLIPWERDAVSVHNHIRGMNPWPGSFTYCRDSYLKIHRAEPYDLIPRSGPPGLVVESSGAGVLVACGRGTVRLKRLQSEGRRPLDVDEFLRGFTLGAGEVLGGRS